MEAVFKDDKEIVDIQVKEAIDALDDIDIIDYAVARMHTINVFVDDDFSDDPYRIRNDIGHELLDHFESTVSLDILYKDSQYMAHLDFNSSDPETHLNSLSGYLELDESETELLYSELPNTIPECKDVSLFVASVVDRNLDEYREEISFLID